MLRSHNCGELRQEQVGTSVVLCGWVQKVRDKGGLIWVDLRDRYGITQLWLDDKCSEESKEVARSLGREFVV
jgi:aspartyl-tRNA synthetase